MEPWKVLSAMVGWQEKYVNSRRSRLAKTVTFWPWWQLFNSSCFETLPFFPVFFLLHKKVASHGCPGPVGVAGSEQGMWVLLNRVTNNNKNSDLGVTSVFTQPTSRPLFTFLYLMSRTIIKRKKEEIM